MKNNGIKNIEEELRIIKNFIHAMPRSYRRRTRNWVVVQDILMRWTSTSGRTSCYEKCELLGIDCDAYTLEPTEIDVLYAQGYQKASDFCIQNGFTRQYLHQNAHKFDIKKVSDKKYYVKLK